MNVDRAVTTLADVLTTPERDGVRLAELSARAGEARPEATVTVTFPFEAGVEAEQVTVTGGEYVDGEITLDIDVTFGDTDQSGVEDAKAADDGGTETSADDAEDEVVTDAAVPAYKDPDRLREVYAEYDSFSEMKEALDVDVTAQTVRRNMMKEGIHVPDTTDDETDTDTAGGEADDGAEGTDTDTSQQAADGAGEPDTKTPERADTDTIHSETPDAVTDGAGDSPPLNRAFSDVDLPDDLTPADVCDAVTESSSLHGVQMALDIEIAEARSLLQELGVLEYVGGRIADNDVDPVEVEERIHDSLRARADGGDGA